MDMDEREMRIIRVRNIADERIDEELLYELFLQAGPINSIIIPGGPNGRKTLAVVEFTYEQAVPYALFIFEGTELYGVRLFLSSTNSNPPSFYVPKDAVQSLPVPAPYGFDISAPSSNMMMNISNCSSQIEPNFEALLQMGQNMLIPPPMGFGGIMSLPMPVFNYNSIIPSNMNQNNSREYGRGRNDFRDRDDYRDHDRGRETDREQFRRNNAGRHRHKRR